MKETFIEFFTFAYPNIKYVVFGSILLSISAAIVGCFTFLKKKALVGDVVSHSVLPGICLAFIISGDKDPLLIIIGAFISGWISIIVMDYIIQNSKIKEDTATGLSLSVFFGFGILLLTYVQHSGNANQSGLDSFLFGKAAALVGDDLFAFSIIAAFILIVVFFFYKEFKLTSFDPEFARSIGLPVRLIEIVLTSITVMAVVTGIQAVGVVLMAAMLITPAAAAKFWTNRLSMMLLLASVFAGFSGVTGAFISYVAPAMPTGPWMVMILSIVALLSFFFAPGKGIATKLIRQNKMKKRFLEENLLKAFYALGERDNDFVKNRRIEEILNLRSFNPQEIKTGIGRLHSQGFLSKVDQSWALTKDGLEKGKRVQRLHRLWELYLTTYLKIAPDHVHEDAESIEHILTPELENQLDHLLDNPSVDPHETSIPQRN